MTSPTGENSSNVGRIALRLPVFWRNNVALWVRQCDSAFVLSQITQDETKYAALVSMLDPETLSHVSDIILSPPAENKYVTLSDRLIREFADSEHQKIKKLLTELQLGDDKPSHLLRKMKELSGGQLQDEFLKNLWLQRLPSQIQTVLSVSSETLDKLAEIADKVADVALPAAKHVREVLQRLDDYGLTINASKCMFGCSEVPFVGYLVNKDGILPLPEKVELIANYKQPTTVRDLRKFLGILNFYRKFLPKAAHIQAPLHEFLKNSKRNDKREVEWNAEAINAFNQCKNQLANVTLLAHPSQDADLALMTDASDFGLGASLNEITSHGFKPLGRSGSAKEPEIKSFWQRWKKFFSGLKKK
ncbi:transposon Tf2-11 polyprotein [Trichonephila inaurata madagascariensis]|uniref:RNA-directed DNA polymerase n=1 Tax=Trichonephila inaurata madagascariensis TaxID=2747483 RepID=A0A8X7C473_9ARAC|nr:transposon Tf2-11 polyprotein [Trichonephila inaurata madagascariensis]